MAEASAKTEGKQQHDIPRETIWSVKTSCTDIDQMEDASRISMVRKAFQALFGIKLQIDKIKMLYITAK